MSIDEGSLKMKDSLSDLRRHVSKEVYDPKYRPAGKISSPARSNLIKAPSFLFWAIVEHPHVAIISQMTRVFGGKGKLLVGDTSTEWKEDPLGVNG